MCLTEAVERRSRRKAVCRARCRCGERVVGQRDEVEAVTAIVGDLDEDALVIGLDDGAGCSGGPASGVCPQLDDVEHVVFGVRHLVNSVAAI
jgi:hypothetical protein